MDPREALTLSSGTISVLTGIADYEEIDKIQLAFYNWIIEQKKDFMNWQSAWNEFKGRN